MASFLEYFFEILKIFFGGLWQIIENFFLGLYNAFFIPKYFETLEAYKAGFDVLAWILAILSLILIFALMAAIIFLIYLGVKKVIRVFKNQHSNEVLIQEVGKLNEQVIRLSKEKDRILGLTLNNAAGGAGASYSEDLEGEGKDDKKVDQSNSRFSKLIKVDEEYANYDPESYPYNHDITLPFICETFRNFACSRMGLFYEIRVIRLFLAGLSSTRLIILQGISGTGKTSLPYAWGKFLENESLIASVQPSWRDRTELFGYFNEFTKRFNETEVLKRMYEARYTNKIYFTILDEMNIARVEYYFAEMLSILEMPSQSEWIVDLVPSAWPSDPKLVKEGRFNLPRNMWYIGTANNDDSTFAISDKVYDRAIPINIDSKGIKFDAPLTDNLHIDINDLERLFVEAKEQNKVSQESLDKVEKLDNYVIEHFRLAFGNRIVKQLRDFVPVYVGTGGTEVDGLDYVLTNKIFRKFEGLNLSFIRDEIDGLIDYLSELFGEQNMQEAKAYLRRLQKLV